MTRRFFESVRILRLRPDDIIVLEFERKLAGDEVLKLVEQGRKNFPNNKVVVTSGVHLRVMRKEDEPGLYREDE